MIKSISLAALALVTLGFLVRAEAQTYPSRPISIVVPFSAGGPTDALTRILAERMSSLLGQTIVVENVTGAAGTIEVGRVARAAPDGYALIMGNLSTHVVNGVVYKLAYDLVNDFEPIALVASNPQLIAARTALPATDLSELVTWLTANGERATQGTAGAGSPAHIGGIFFQAATGTRFQFIPYRGAAPIMQDLIAGQIDFTLAQTANALPQLRAGKIKVFAVTAPKRIAEAPEIPTADEAGLPGFHISIWHALWAPKGTPADITTRINAALIQTLADEKIVHQLSSLGIEIPPREQQTPDGLRAYHQAEIAKWTPLLATANIKPE
jgi:tripartite-type tricarboxylate transporter receptor subunit TctC